MLHPRLAAVVPPARIFVFAWNDPTFTTMEAPTVTMEEDPNVKGETEVVADAIKAGDLEKVKHLVQNGFQVNQLLKYRRTPTR